MLLRKLQGMTIQRRAVFTRRAARSIRSPTIRVDAGCLLFGIGAVTAQRKKDGASPNGDTTKYRY